MGNIIWLIIMVPVSMLFTGIGVYAWKRKKPMWFWSGSTVKESKWHHVASLFIGYVDQYDSWRYEYESGRNSLNCWLYHRSPSSSNSLWKDLPKLQKMTPD